MFYFSLYNNPATLSQIESIKPNLHGATLCLLLGFTHIHTSHTYSALFIQLVMSKCLILSCFSLILKIVDLCDILRQLGLFLRRAVISIGHSATLQLHREVAPVESNCEIWCLFVQSLVLFYTLDQICVICL